jgi:hypothetical protein
MTKTGTPITASDFYNAQTTSSNAFNQEPYQLGAHVQATLNGASGFAVGDYSQALPPVIPEPQSMILFGTGLIAAASIRRFRRK